MIYKIINALNVHQIVHNVAVSKIVQIAWLVHSYLILIAF